MGAYKPGPSGNLPSGLSGLVRLVARQQPPWRGVRRPTGDPDRPPLSWRGTTGLQRTDRHWGLAFLRTGGFPLQVRGEASPCLDREWTPGWLLQSWEVRGDTHRGPQESRWRPGVRLQFSAVRQVSD